jgi:hypothetical protein
VWSELTSETFASKPYPESHLCVLRLCSAGPFNIDDESESIQAGTSFLTANQVKVRQDSVKPVRMILQAQSDGMYMRVSNMYTGLEMTRSDPWARYGGIPDVQALSDVPKFC